MFQSNVCLPELLPRDSRLLALDALRGLSVASMIAVISPGRWEFALKQLSHADWVGAPYADMIFPTFLVSVGLAMTLSFANRIQNGATAPKLLWHILRRSVLLIGLGLLLNLYDSLSFATVRIPGVLQRIGLCYLLGSLLYVPLRRHWPTDAASERRARLFALVSSIAALLLGYYCLLRFVPVPGFGPGHLDSDGNLGAWLDRRIFTVPHLWLYGTTPGVGVTFDPEGLLSTIPALCTMLMGVVAGELLRTPKPLAWRTGMVATAGAAFLAAAFALQPFIPFIKKIWTPSFACLSGGVALLAFSVLLYLIDVRGWRRWSLPLQIFGSNAILAFTFSWILLIELGRLRRGGLRGNVWLYDHLFGSWIANRQLASLGTALFLVLVNLLLLVPFYRRNWLLRL